MESDISLSLCSDQTLVKGKQSLVDFIHIIVSPFDKIFYNDVEFARMGKGEPCLSEHLLYLGKWYPFVIFALPVSQPCSVLHSASSSGPAAR